MRPKNPNDEKLSVYECGVPTIGSSFVQFDLRFYVIALLFIIFDVEVAFFFSVGCGLRQGEHLTDPNFAVVQTSETVRARRRSRRMLRPFQANSACSTRSWRISRPDARQMKRAVRDGAKLLAKTSIGDILIFFAVLMGSVSHTSGVAATWIGWRAVADERSQAAGFAPRAVEGSESVVAG